MVLGGNRRKIHTDSEEGFGVDASIRVILFKKIGAHSKIKRAGLDTKKKSRKQRKNGGRTRGNTTGTDHSLK